RKRTRDLDCEVDASDLLACANLKHLRLLAALRLRVVGAKRGGCIYRTRQRRGRRVAEHHAPAGEAYDELAGWQSEEPIRTGIIGIDREMSGELDATIDASDTLGRDADQ